MTTLTRADWEQRAKNLQIEGRALIHGEHRDAVSGQTFECVSPVDGRVLGLIASCDAADADVAVRDARATFESGVWSRMKPVERKKIMIRFADLLDAHAEELALLETLRHGQADRLLPERRRGRCLARHPLERRGDRQDL